MIGSSRAVRVWARREPTDLRKGFNGLFYLVENTPGLDPLSGDLFLFVNQRRTSAKVLLWDGTGLCVFAKRLERRRFACLWRDPPGAPLRLTSTELSLFLEGSELVGKVQLSPAKMQL